MQTLDDAELLRHYVAQRSDQPFEEIVSRHVNLVYSAALRQVRNPHIAEEITQAVFIILAKKAHTIRQGSLLVGWLLKTTRFAAGIELRAIGRRFHREQVAYMESMIQQESASEPEWDDLAPLLDEAVAHLGEKDRNAVVMRFFENKPLAEVGEALGVNSDAAQKRVSRALEKLRGLIRKHGVSISSVTLITLLSANAVQAAPSTLPSVAAAAALKGAAATAGTSTATLIKGTLKIMAWTKAKTAIVAGVGMLLATGAAVPVWEYNFGKNSWEHRFDSAYKLQRGEIVRYIKPPFVSARADFYHTYPDLRMQAQTNPKPPDRFIFEQHDQESPVYRQCAFAEGSTENPLRSALSEMLKFKQYELEGPANLLNLNVYGDWTIRSGASREAVLATLEAILFKVTHHRVHFEKRTVERDVIAVSGKMSLDQLKETGISGGKLVKMYAEHPQYKCYQSLNRNTLEDLVAVLGEHLQTYVVNETQLSEGFDLECFIDADVWTAGNRQAELAEKVLKNLAAQTGLVFNHQQRPVDVWFVTEL
jgi:uncharacterized protein (TIGR03435 family)